MKQYPFLPMTVQSDYLTIDEPVASKIKQHFSLDSLDIQSDYISISIKDIKEKEQFIEKIASSIKRIQSEMINSFLQKPYL